VLTGNLQIKNDTYYAVINFKQGDKYKQKWITTKLKTKGNKRKATEFLNNVIEKYSSMDLEKRVWNIKFTDYAQKWLENKKGTVEQCTWDGYYDSVEKHIIPYFKNLDLYIKDIKPIHISEYYNYKFRNGRCDNKGGLSMCALKVHKFVLKAIFSKAMSVSKIIQENLGENVKLFKFVEDKKKEEVFLNQEEVRKMLKAFQGHPLEHLIFIALCYGLRRSEVLGLKWKAINFEENTLKIEHTVVKER
jgi:Site-specific recombinase XerD